MILARVISAALVIAAASALSLASAQSPSPIPPGPRGIVDNPCPPPLAPPADLTRGKIDLSQPPPPAVAAFLQEQDRRARVDWANLCRYAPDNAARVAAKAPAPTAVFMGDSITEGWARTGAEFFSTNGYVGRGISGQVSGQNLLRFEQDVVALHPKVVHIMIGTNDVAGNAGLTTNEEVERNLKAMVQLARANGIRVVLATIPPTSDFPWRKGMEPAQKIITLNTWIRDYAKHEGITLADYHTALADSAGGFHSGWSGDGVHPNATGFDVMKPIASAAIKAALTKAR